MIKVRQIDVTKNKKQVAEFVRDLGRITQPIEILVEGHVVGRIVPPGELSEAEKEQLLRRGWELVQEARLRNEGLSEKKLGKIVDSGKIEESGTNEGSASKDVFASACASVSVKAHHPFLGKERNRAAWCFP